VERNLDNADISVETMAEELGMSRVHLYKKLTAITDLTPSEFIRQIRLRHAEQLLSKSQLTVAEVAYKVGFNNPRYLSKYFKEMYGVMPSEYKNRNKNEMSGN
jgi:AraC-like DNA-binding protein